jgi:hypothetical protein
MRGCNRNLPRCSGYRIAGNYFIATDRPTILKTYETRIDRPERIPHNLRIATQRVKPQLPAKHIT